MNPGTIVGGNPSIEKRVNADFYPTPPECTRALMRDFGWLFAGAVVWEPACGDGAMAGVIGETASSVISTDLHDRGFGAGGVDFLTADKPVGVEAIITNPPFVEAEAFIRAARKHGVPFAMLLRGVYWHAKTRLPLFKETGPYAVCPLTWRPAFAPQRGSAPTLDYCWTVWTGKPESSCRFMPMGK